MVTSQVECLEVLHVEGSGESFGTLRTEFVVWYVSISHGTPKQTITNTKKTTVNTQTKPQREQIGVIIVSQSDLGG